MNIMESDIVIKKRSSRRLSLRNLRRESLKQGLCEDHSSCAILHNTYSQVKKGHYGSIWIEEQTRERKKQCRANCYRKSFYPCKENLSVQQTRKDSSNNLIVESKNVNTSCKILEGKDNLEGCMNEFSDLSLAESNDSISFLCNLTNIQLNLHNSAWLKNKVLHTRPSFLGPEEEKRTVQFPSSHKIADSNMHSLLENVSFPFVSGFTLQERHPKNQVFPCLDSSPVEYYQNQTKVVKNETGTEDSEHAELLSGDNSFQVNKKSPRGASQANTPTLIESIPNEHVESCSSLTFHSLLEENALFDSELKTETTNKEIHLSFDECQEDKSVHHKMLNNDDIEDHQPSLDSEPGMVIEAALQKSPSKNYPGLAAVPQFSPNNLDRENLLFNHHPLCHDETLISDMNLPSLFEMCRGLREKTDSLGIPRVDSFIADADSQIYESLSKEYKMELDTDLRQCVEPKISKYIAFEAAETCNNSSSTLSSVSLSDNMEISNQKVEQDVKSCVFGKMLTDDREYSGNLKKIKYETVEPDAYFLHEKLSKKSNGLIGQYDAILHPDCEKCKPDMLSLDVSHFNSEKKTTGNCPAKEILNSPDFTIPKLQEARKKSLSKGKKKNLVPTRFSERICRKSVERTINQTRKNISQDMELGEKEKTVITKRKSKGQKEERIKNIYFNKNYKKLPGTNLETIYEFPIIVENKCQLISHKKYKRFLTFSVDPLKLKKRREKSTYVVQACFTVKDVMRQLGEQQ